MAHKTHYEHDPIEMLEQDHKNIKELFKKYREFDDGAAQQKEEAARRIFAELGLHTRIEEEIFYPAVEASQEKGAEKMVTEGYLEHSMAKSIIDELRGTETRSVEFEAGMKVLMENVEHHIEEEESRLFPLARKELPEELDTLGMEMEKMKKQAPAGM